MKSQNERQLMHIVQHGRMLAACGIAVALAVCPRRKSKGPFCTKNAMTLGAAVSDYLWHLLRTHADWLRLFL